MENGETENSSFEHLSKQVTPNPVGAKRRQVWICIGNYDMKPLNL
jgi:hypothetical protein